MKREYIKPSLNCVKFETEEIMDISVNDSNVEIDPIPDQGAEDSLLD